MESRKLIILSLVFAPLLCRGETASDYMNRGAQEYIFGNDDKAAAEVQTGLTKFPDDPELRKMTALFHKKKQQQRNNQSQQNQQQQSQSQRSSGGNNQDKQQQNQQTQSQNHSNANQSQDSQDQSSQQMAKNQPQKNQQQQPKPGESPSPSQGSDQQQQNNPNGKQEQPDQSPTPGMGEDQAPSPSPGEGAGEAGNAQPSGTPIGSPERQFAGEIKDADQDKQSPSKQNAKAFGETEPEKEGQMSEKQAELLLQSMKDEEARVQLDERKARRRVYNDW